MITCDYEKIITGKTGQLMSFTQLSLPICEIIMMVKIGRLFHLNVSLSDAKAKGNEGAVFGIPINQ